MNHKGKLIDRDIVKAIHYLSLSSDQNNENAKLMLGFIYYENKYTIRNILKVIGYLRRATNKNHKDAQFLLGNSVPQDIKLKMEIEWLILSMSFSFKKENI